LRAPALVAVLGIGILGLGQGFGAGYSGAGLLLWDVSALNAALETAGYPTLEGSLFLYGGMGAGGEELRFGLGGFGGSLSAHEGARVSQISLGFGGAVAEVPFGSAKGFSLCAGALLGAGGAELLLRSRDYGSFGDALSAPSDLYLSRGFALALPYISLEFWPVGWLGLRAVVGALIPFLTSPWEADGTALPGPPGSFGGPYLTFLVAFGGREAPEEAQAD